MGFSEFIRDATEEEKKEVYDRVVKESTKNQRKAAGIPSGDDVLSAYNDQCTDDKIELSEIIDNAILMTMRACWGIKNE